ncbi:transposase [Klebsiella pneumoniae]|nr:transposase [Klebsiella pneumoniae]
MVLPDTSRCWAMKELARELWSRRYDEQSRRLWQEWIAMAKDVGVPLLSSAARTLRKRGSDRVAAITANFQAHVDRNLFPYQAQISHRGLHERKSAVSVL